MSFSRNAAAPCLALVLLAAGCGGHQAAAPEVRRPSLEQDPCATRLHDLSGRLLLYYAANRRLPESLDDLPPLDPANPTPAVCPVSGDPYIYNPKGVAIAGRPGLLVLYDPLPSHAGMRWGVFANREAGGPGLTARVLLLPEGLFTPAAKPPAAAPE
jgi:hypothetical protein